MKSTFAKILLNIIGVFFILSAVAKLFPIIQFEFLLGSFSIPWGWTPYLARTIISFELILGFLLLFQFRMQKLTIPLTIRFLILMIIILVYRRITAGPDADCGCMGDWWTMTPVQSIIKNVVLIGLLAWIKGNVVSNTWSDVWKKVLLCIVVASAVAPYVIEPVYIGQNTAKNEQEVYDLDVDLFYTANQAQAPKIDLKEGKHVIVFLSVKCPHCQLAARKLGIIQKGAPQFPIYFFINGSDEEVDQFREKFENAHVPYSRLLMPQFLQLAGPEIPAIYFVEEGKVVRKVDYLDIDVSSIEKFLR